MPTFSTSQFISPNLIFFVPFHNTLCRDMNTNTNIHTNIDIDTTSIVHINQCKP